MAFDEKVKVAAFQLGKRLDAKPWFWNVGISEEEGHPVLIVYLKDNASAAAKIVPKEWQGMTVRMKRIGKLRPA
jgi:hypothetical protein